MAGLDLSGFDQAVAAHQAANPQALNLGGFDGSSASLAQPGMLESLLRGAEQGATMGFAPRVNAALETAKNELENDIGETNAPTPDYDASLKDALSRFKAAQAAHPYVYGAGNVAGFAVPTALTGGANLTEEGTLGAAKAGAAYGALSGLGSSQDLTNVPDAAKNALLGAGIGAVTGGVAGGAADLLGPHMSGIKNLMSGAGEVLSDTGPIPGIMASYNKGAEGENLFGKTAHNEAIRALQTRFQDAKNLISQELSKAGADQQAAIASGQQSIPLTDWLTTAYNAGNNLIKNAVLSSDKDAVGSVLAKLGDFIDNSGLQDNNGNVSLKQLYRLKQELGQMGSTGDEALTNPIARQFVNRLLSPLSRDPNMIESDMGLPDSFTPLRTLTQNAADQLGPANARINQLLDAQDLMPNLNSLARSEKNSIAGVASSKQLSNFLGALPDDVRQQIEPGMTSAIQSKDIADQIASSGFNPGLGLAKSAKGMTMGLGNWAGLAKNAVGEQLQNANESAAQSGLGKAFQTLYNQSPEAFNSIGTAMSNMGGTAADVGKALIGAAQKDQYGRNAVIFALTQNPAYRDQMDKMFGKEMESDQPTSQGQLNNLNE